MKTGSSRLRSGVFSGLIVCAVVLLYGALALLNACTPMILCKKGEADVGARAAASFGSTAPP